MDELKKEIKLLKTKIYNEIESFRIYEELVPICDMLVKEIDNYQYDDQNELSLKKYRAYLEVLLESRIGVINKMIIGNENSSIFDNRTANAEKELTDLEQELESVLTYINLNLPAIGVEATEKYNSIKEFYTDLIEYTKGSIARSLASDIGAKEGEHSAPVLSLYADTSAVNRIFIANLMDYKYRYIDSINKFVENDKKIKETILKAYESDNPQTIELVKKIDEHYKSVIAKCMDSGNILANLLLPKIQENVKEIIKQLDQIVYAEEKKKEYRQDLLAMRFNAENNDKILEIDQFVAQTGELTQEFYDVLYVMVEKEKYLVENFGEKPILYSQLSEESKLALEKKFIERLSNRGQEFAQEQIKKLKIEGYPKVLDFEYEEYFKNLDYKEIPSYKFDQIENPVILQCKPYADKKDNKYFVISNVKTGRDIDVTPNERSASVEDSFTFCKGIYEMVYNHYDKWGFYKYTHYKSWDEEGNRIKVPRDIRVEEKVFGNYYITLFNKTGKKHSKIIDRYGRSLYRDGNIDFFDEYAIDYEQQQILINNHSTNTMKLFDKDMNLIQTIDIDKIKEEAKKLGANITADTKPSINVACCFNSDTFPIKFGIMIIYYNLFLDKIIDKFIDKEPKNSYYGVSEDLFVFKGQNQRFGYKERYLGSEEIEPKYIEAHPFYGGVALVKDESHNSYLINSKGNRINISNYLGDGCRIEMMPHQRRYVIHDKNDNIYTIEPSYRHVLGDDALISSIQTDMNLAFYERHHI